MFRYKMVATAIVVSFLTLGASTAMASGWERIGVEDGVEVHFKEEGDDFSARGEITVDVHIGKIIAVFVNPNERPHWVGNYVDHETLDITRSHERYWLKLDPSRLVSSRDYVIESRYNFDEDKRVFTANSRSVEDERKPEQDCCTRAVSTTKYTIEAVPGKEQTKINVEVQTDPKGRIPRRSVRSAVQDWPVSTLNNLTRRAQIDGMRTDPRVKDWHK